MTPLELEAMVQDLNRRVTDIEQILPTLATRRDLEALATKKDLETLRVELTAELRTEFTAGLTAVSAELTGKFSVELVKRFDEAKRYALVLHEDLKSHIGLIAEHLADVMSRLPPRQL